MFWFLAFVRFAAVAGLRGLVWSCERCCGFSPSFADFVLVPKNGKMGHLFVCLFVCFIYPDLSLLRDMQATTILDALAHFGLYYLHEEVCSFIGLWVRLSLYFLLLMVFGLAESFHL